MNNNDLTIDYASKSIRFSNLMIDKLFFWILYIVHVFLFENQIKMIVGEGLAVKNIAYFLLLYFLYYLVFESLFGRTPGHFFFNRNKSRRGNERNPNFKTMFIRNLCRLIPFDPFSFAVGDSGWHDSISKTLVINT